ncbi:MAG TPA: competence type IV pilus minor pilin ComGF [Virgibacillus sp.]|nr:competence type IV pilus minor pilin ComGF [Virgibacillus sp.]
MGSLKTESGFTMISLLIAFGFLVISLPILTHTLKSVQYESLDEKLSVEHFFMFVRNDLIKSQDFMIKDNTLYHTIEYKAYKWDEAKLTHRNNQIVRTLRGGHEVYLTNVKGLHLAPIENGIEITVTMIGGEIYTKKIIFYQS